VGVGVVCVGCALEGPTQRVQSAKLALSVIAAGRLPYCSMSGQRLYFVTSAVGKEKKGVRCGVEVSSAVG
jgi:hypothetical protein